MGPDEPLPPFFSCSFRASLSSCVDVFCTGEATRRLSFLRIYVLPIKHHAKPGGCWLPLELFLELERFSHLIATPTLRNCNDHCRVVHDSFAIFRRGSNPFLESDLVAQMRWRSPKSIRRLYLAEITQQTCLHSRLAHHDDQIWSIPVYVSFTGPFTHNLPT